MDLPDRVVPRRADAGGLADSVTVPMPAPVPPAITATASTDDPPPVRLINGEGRAPLVIVCDHASNAIPANLHNLGLTPEERAQHIAWDIGAAAVAAELARLLDAPALFSGVSRLVIDINRDPADFTSIREIYDEVIIPGNRDLDPAKIAERAARWFWPYHRKVAATLAHVRRRTDFPALISVHSFTDRFRNRQRPWHIGVLSNHDRRMAEPLMQALRAHDPGLVVGDNRPYSGMDAFGFTIEHHALPTGLPNILLEIRQDLLHDRQGQMRMAAMLAGCLAPMAANADLFQPFAGPPNTPADGEFAKES